MSKYKKILMSESFMTDYIFSHLDGNSHFHENKMTKYTLINTYFGVIN